MGCSQKSTRDAESKLERTSSPLVCDDSRSLDQTKRRGFLQQTPSIYWHIFRFHTNIARRISQRRKSWSCATDTVDLLAYFSLKYLVLRCTIVPVVLKARSVRACAICRGAGMLRKN